MDKLYIIIPAYNEEETIKQVINDWYPVIERIGNESKLVIINDGSKDHTYEIIQEYAASHPYLLPLTKENSGHGATVLFGYHYAIKENADYIFQTDSDGQTLPDEFDAFWALRNEYDMIIGHRNKREDGASRWFVTKVLKFVLWVCFGVRITDANTPFRLLKKDTFAQYIDKVPENFNLSNVLISVIYMKNELKVKYIPITFRPRQGGVNSINLPKICKIGKQALKDFRAINQSLKNS